MAETSRVKPSASPAPSRLQRRRPATLQISPSSWNAAIPLLSPLAPSPTALDFKSIEIQQPPQQRACTGNSDNKNSSSQENLVFKKWQHPAAPFCHESASFNPSFFVPV